MDDGLMSADEIVSASSPQDDPEFKLAMRYQWFPTMALSSVRHFAHVWSRYIRPIVIWRTGNTGESNQYNEPGELYKSWHFSSSLNKMNLHYYNLFQFSAKLEKSEKGSFIFNNIKLRRIKYGSRFNIKAS